MIETVTHDDILEIIVANPPVNALGASIRIGLASAIAKAQADAAIKAILIRGAGKLFSGGADITEFNQPPVDPMLQTAETVARRYASLANDRMHMGCAPKCELHRREGQGRSTRKSSPSRR